MQSEYPADQRFGTRHSFPEIGMNIANKDLFAQIDTLREILTRHDIIRTVLESAKRLRLSNWYLGAGCIAQTVWNRLSGNDLSYHIQDLDFVYFNSDDISEEGEQRVAERVNHLFAGSPIPFDVRNQARVHMWYESYFGYPIPPYNSLEEAINSWPTTATSIGITFRQGGFEITVEKQPMTGVHCSRDMMNSKYRIEISSGRYSSEYDELHNITWVITLKMITYRVNDEIELSLVGIE